MASYGSPSVKTDTDATTGYRFIDSMTIFVRLAGIDRQPYLYCQAWRSKLGPAYLLGEGDGDGLR